jgi:hypothetical protein
VISMDDQSAKDPNSTSEDVVPAAGQRSTAMHDAYVDALLVERAAMARAGKDSRVDDVDAALEAAGYQAPPSQAVAPVKRTAAPPVKRTTSPPKKRTTAPSEPKKS